MRSDAVQRSRTRRRDVVAMPAATAHSERSVQ